jgi:Tol biopolymer transport system component
MRKLATITIFTVLMICFMLPIPLNAAKGVSSTEQLLSFVANKTLYSVKSDGTDLKQILSSVYRYDWSPDKRYIAFSRVLNDGGQQILIANADGTNPRLLIAFSQDEILNYGIGTILWSPDGTKLAFDVSKQGNSAYFSQIYIVSIDGQVLHSWSGYVSSWIADGKGIAYVWANGTCNALYKVMLDGSDRGQYLAGCQEVGWNSTELVLGQDCSFNHSTGSNASWSHSTNSFAITLDRGADCPIAIYLVDENGKNVRLIAENAWIPKWSSDDKFLAHYFYKDRNKGEICLVQLTILKTRCTTSSFTQIKELAWAPDDQQIAFTMPIDNGSVVCILNSVTMDHFCLNLRFGGFSNLEWK